MGSRRTSGAEPARTHRGGFTLIEVLGAVFLTAMVIAAAVGSYVNLSDASTRAAARMREKLHVTTLLDRVARDLRAANLVVKPAETDPLNHPWYFVAESESSFDGSDRVKLIARSQQPRVTAYHASGLAEIAYFTRQEDDGSLTLLRWVSPSLPEAYSLGFPSEDDPATWIVAEGLGSFSLRFMGEGGEWSSEWDSTQIVESSALPYAVEIKVSMLGENEDPDAAFAEDEIDYVTRKVILPMRPLDLEAMIQEKLENQAGGGPGGLGGFGGGADGEAPTPAACAEIQAQVCVQFPIACDAQGNILAEFASTEAQLRAEYGCP